MSTPQPHNVARPAPGFYLVRLVSRGWAVPASVAIEDDLYRFVVDGETYPAMTAEDLDERIVNWLTAEKPDPVTCLLLRGQPCDEVTFAHRNATREWARLHSPRHPSVNPRQKIDTRLMRPEDF